MKTFGGFVGVAEGLFPFRFLGVRVGIDSI
jgi:hypothetical protein